MNAQLPHYNDEYRNVTLLRDPYGRFIRYIRLSVTGLCNLKCCYCRHGTDHNEKVQRTWLSDDEIIVFMDVATEFGIHKIRLTGGEPLMRPGLVGLVEKLSQKHPNLDIRLTTNGTLLEKQIDRLKTAGLHGVTISLDTFNPKLFKFITGSNAHRAVLRAIDKVLLSGLLLKLNVVAMKGVNEAELPLFLQFAREHGVEVRFIEFMPIGAQARENKGMFWPADTIYESASRHAVLKRLVCTEECKGPAKLFSVDNGAGRFGIISSVSDHFCNSCNRLRVTADGNLRACLYSDRQFPMRPVLQELARMAGDQELLKDALRTILRTAVSQKPLGAALLHSRGYEPVSETCMSDIGG